MWSGSGNPGPFPAYQIDRSHLFHIRGFVFRSKSWLERSPIVVLLMLFWYDFAAEEKS